MDDGIHRTCSSHDSGTGSILFRDFSAIICDLDDVDVPDDHLADRHSGEILLKPHAADYLKGASTFFSLKAMGAVSELDVRPLLTLTHD